MGTIIALILFPMVIAGILTFIKDKKVQGIIAKGSAVLCIALTIAVAVLFAHENGEYFSFGGDIIRYIAVGVELIICGIITIAGIIRHRWIAPFLSVVQTGAIVWFELVPQNNIITENNFAVDGLALIAVLLAGLLGGGAIVACTQKKEILLLVGATCGIVLSNDLVMMYMFWQISTLAFWLTAGEKALKINLFGGATLVAGIIIAGIIFETVEISGLIVIGSVYADLIAIPAAFIGITALIRAGQAPFSSWVIKANSLPVLITGVYLLIRISPVLGPNNYAGIMVAICGGITLIMSSMAAVYVTDAEKVLPYWTIGIAGIIATCCGVGSSGALWAAIMLLICSGIVVLLVHTSEENSPFALGGIVGMITLPFAFFASRWGSFTAIADTGNIILLLCLIFGTSLSAVVGIRMISRGKGFKVYAKAKSLSMIMFMAFVALMIGSPFISRFAVIPYLEGTFGGLAGASMSSGEIAMTVFLVLTVLVAVIPKLKYRQEEENEAIDSLEREDNLKIISGIVLNEDHVVISGYVLSGIMMVIGTGYVVATLVSLVGGAA